jgi:BirA family biotin operon repressor/biotin-[acetyl-CoA-carboxylase] ligase
LYDAIYDTLIIAKKLIYLPSCHSTNDIAAELVHENLFEEGVVVITDDQTNGRGQRGNTWLTQPGMNLTFSVVLKPEFIAVQNQFLLSKVVALTVCSYLRTYSEDVKIKWPNDIYLGDKKICGILIENSIQGMRLSSSVIGIGININQATFDNERATSLAEAMGRNFSLNDEFNKIIHHLDALYFKSKSIAGIAAIDQEYLQRMFGYNQERTFETDGKRITGRITGVTSWGQLLLMPHGMTNPIAFNHKEIVWLWE